MQHYKNLQVWQRSHKLVLGLYRASQMFPNTEQYGLTSQLRRAALSVPTNIVEGSKRAAPKEYAHFLNIAEGSLSETEYLVLVSRDLVIYLLASPEATWRRPESYCGCFMDCGEEYRMTAIQRGRREAVDC